MKMMIIGDMHFGVRNNSLPYLDFQTKWFEEELIPNIKKHDCEHVLFLGDVFDSRNSLSPLILRRVRTLFKKLTNIVNVHCILGNHDLFFRNNKSVHSLDVLSDQGVIVYENRKELTIGKSKILMLPWIVKDEQKEVMEDLVNNTYDAVFGHLEINDFEMVPGVVEENGLRRSLFSSHKHVFSGHFHLRRKIGNIQYTGTPYELSWSDYGDEKGVFILDTITKEETFLPTTSTPKHLKISNLDYSIDDLTKKIITNNILRISFKGKITEVDKINFIEKINSLVPLSSIIDDDTDEDFATEENLESSIKDTIGFLNEFLNLIEVPDGIDPKIVRGLLTELHDECV